MTRLVVIALALAVVLAGAGCDGDDDAPEPGSSGAGLIEAIGAARPAVAPFEGLTEVDLSIGGECVRVVVADETGEQIQGLRAVTDLGPYAGMLFAFAGDTETSFTMADTLIPLSIGFFSAEGDRVAQLEMVPCPVGTACPSYPPGAAFRFALEVPAADPLPPALVPCERT